MPNFERVNEYRKVKNSGVTRIQATGHGMRLYADEVTYIYTAGIGYETNGTTTHNVFTVHLTNGRQFITDWDGVGIIDNTVRVNEYAKTLQEDGTLKLQYTDHGVRVNPDNVVDIYTAGLGYELDGVTTHECFTVRMSTGEKFITDWAGIQDIQSY
jgi:hypothetical protein